MWGKFTVVFYGSFFFFSVSRGGSFCRKQGFALKPSTDNSNQMNLLCRPSSILHPPLHPPPLHPPPLHASICAPSINTPIFLFYIHLPSFHLSSIHPSVCLSIFRGRLWETVWLQ